MTIDKCRTCKHAFATGKDRLYCKKSLADKDDCGEYSVIEQEPGHWIIMGNRYIKCSKCRHITKTESPDIYNFCMVCGTKMSENPTHPESEE